MRHSFLLMEELTAMEAKTIRALKFCLIPIVERFTHVLHYQSASHAWDDSDATSPGRILRMMFPRLCAIVDATPLPHASLRNVATFMPTDQDAAVAYWRTEVPLFWEAAMADREAVEGSHYGLQPSTVKDLFDWKVVSIIEAFKKGDLNVFIEWYSTDISNKKTAKRQVLSLGLHDPGHQRMAFRASFNWNQYGNQDEDDIEECVVLTLSADLDAVKYQERVFQCCRADATDPAFVFFSEEPAFTLKGAYSIPEWLVVGESDPPPPLESHALPFPSLRSICLGRFIAQWRTTSREDKLKVIKIFGLQPLDSLRCKKRPHEGDTAEEPRTKRPRFPLLGQ